jgi:hypothetical protein
MAFTEAVAVIPKKEATSIFGSVNNGSAKHDLRHCKNSAVPRRASVRG